MLAALTHLLNVLTTPRCPRCWAPMTSTAEELVCRLPAVMVTAWRCPRCSERVRRYTAYDLDN